MFNNNSRIQEINEELNKLLVLKKKFLFFSLFLIISLEVLEEILLKKELNFDYKQSINLMNYTNKVNKEFVNKHGNKMKKHDKEIIIYYDKLVQVFNQSIDSLILYSSLFFLCFLFFYTYKLFKISQWILTSSTSCARKITCCYTT